MATISLSAGGGWAADVPPRSRPTPTTMMIEPDRLRLFVPIASSLRHHHQVTAPGYRGIA
jgi:hypothetical protein